MVAKVAKVCEEARSGMHTTQEEGSTLIGLRPWSRKPWMRNAAILAEQQLVTETVGHEVLTS